MRAILKADAERGPGYGVIEIEEAGSEADVIALLRRVSDGKYLSADGWRDGASSLKTRDIEPGNNFSRLFLGPDVIDNLDAAENYELEIVGTGVAPLLKKEFFQSRENGARYANVEPTPEIDPGYIDAGARISGVAAGSGDAVVERRPRRRGCFVVAIALFIFWAIGAWWLWQGVLEAPPKAGDGEETPFEFIPSNSG